MILLVDIDGVLNNFVEVCVRMYNEAYGTEHDYKSVTTYDIASSLGIENWDAFLNNYILSSRITDACEPTPEAPKYLRLINEICTLYWVTARNWCQLTNINNWKEKFYPFINDRQIIRCQDKNLIMGDILVDDSLDKLLSFSRGRICFDRPYNRDIDDNTNFITRVHNWQECYDVIKLKL
jgi:5'(3')-deoxyribonucleotidase